MLLRWDIEHPGQTKLMPAPIPTWDGVEYVDSAALPTFRSGDGFGPQEGIGGSNLTSFGGGGGLEGTLEPTADGGGGVGGGDPTVLITEAVYKAADEEFRVEGTISGATWVAIHDGGMSGGKCKGQAIATTDVGRGTFLWRTERLATIPTKVCVTTSAGAVNAVQVLQVP
jgi:hypothetical protein